MKDWKHEVSLPKIFLEHLNEFLNMLSKFQDMWDSHLGRISMKKHRKESSSEGNKPAHSVPYRVGSKPRQIFCRSIEKWKPKKSSNRQLQSGPAKLFLPQRRMDHYVSVWITRHFTPSQSMTHTPFHIRTFVLNYFARPVVFHVWFQFRLLANLNW